MEHHTDDAAVPIRAGALLVLALLVGCGDDTPTAPPTLLGDRESFAGNVALTLTVGADRTELRGGLRWDRGSGEAVWEAQGADRRLILRRGAGGAAQARLEVDGAEVQLDPTAQRELFALAALLYQTPRDTAEVVGLGAGIDGYRIRERDRSLEVRLGSED